MAPLVCRCVSKHVHWPLKSRSSTNLTRQRLPRNEHNDVDREIPRLGNLVPRTLGEGFTQSSDFETLFRDVLCQLSAKRRQKVSDAGMGLVFIPHTELSRGLVWRRMPPPVRKVKARES
ncbi:hypothetical protein CISG_07994 [Coccidioides immitis RMSCC 3703]|uniref:Uncharacterized protein n=2 Tax=Coccidioides immitis TaxID=5501 RepID=A0A0J8R4J8_COCIT|nr:hypothetical protein CIRG_03778 [Coccidioides immitis RMSCC 2394]KMU80044.1 hypothetical protein CISG_07994 [Coccidioides immitis RMSCC 3703]